MLDQATIAGLMQDKKAREEQLDRLTRQHQTFVRVLVRLLDETAGKSTTLVEWGTVESIMEDAVVFVKNASKKIKSLS